MILQAETLIKYGYLPFDLKPHSNRPIIAKCDGCGTVKITSKNNYHAKCLTCALKGKYRSEEIKAKIRATKTGKKHPHKGFTSTEEQNAKHSVDMTGKKNPMFGKRGTEIANYNGGKKLVAARHHAKRRGLGHISLNTSFEGCEGHHITHTFVIYVPKALHRSICHNINTGQGMEAINALALDFLVNGF